MEASPQTPAGIRSELEIAIEREPNNVGCSNDRRFFQPNAMLYAVQMKHGMPVVEVLPQVSVA